MDSGQEGGRRAAVSWRLGGVQPLVLVPPRFSQPMTSIHLPQTSLPRKTLSLAALHSTQAAAKPDQTKTVLKQY